VNVERRDFADRDALATALAKTVATRLETAIAERGEASIALSGGSTPERFLNVLSQTDLDWGKVSVTLVDERWVPPDSDRSNARLVAERLWAWAPMVTPPRSSPAATTSPRRSIRTIRRC
jgi:6-phosphogluconolactonase